jgi:hypothetical protein
MAGGGRRLFLFLISCVCATVTSLPQPPLSSAQEVRVEKVNGVIVVHNPKNPKPPPGTPSRLVLAEDLVLGKDRHREDYWFSAVNSIAVDDLGDIFVMDPKDIRIRLFSPHGRLIRAFGRQGQGPGEFGGPAIVGMTADGMLIVHDIHMRRFSFLSPEGETLREISDASFSFGNSRFDSRGFVYATSHKSTDPHVTELVKLSPQVIPLATLAAIEQKIKPKTVDLFSDIFFFDVTRRDELVWMVSSKYELYLVGPEGKTVRRIVKDYDPPRFTEADRDAYLKRLTSRASPIRFDYEFPKVFPPVSGLLVDDENRVYVRTWEKDKSGNIFFDVFAPEGRWMCRFSLPEMEYPAVCKKGKLYMTIQESEEGIPLVKRYALRWE